MKQPNPTQIKQARVKAGFTQQQAGELIHGSRRTWQDWERGVTPMPLPNWELFLIKTEKN